MALHVALYYIPELQKNKNVSLNLIEGSTYFAGRPRYVFPNDYVGWIKDENSFEQAITIPRNLYKNYNYVMVKHESGTPSSTNPYYCYYVVDVKEFGNDQFELKLELDTVMTYVIMSKGTIVDVESKKSLVLREHKDRFDFDNNKILIHDTIETGNQITPIVKSSTSNFVHSRTRFVYRNRTLDWKPVAYVYTAGSGVTVQTPGGNWVGNVYSGPNYPKQTYAWTGDYKYSLDSSTSPNIDITDTWSTHYHAIEWIDLGNAAMVYRYKKSNGQRDGSVFQVPSPQNYIRISVGVQPANFLYPIIISSSGTGPTWSLIQANYKAINFFSSGTSVLPQFFDIDPFDAMNQKIVEVPYLDTTMDFKRDEFGIYVELTDSNVKTINNVPVSLPNGNFNLTKDDIPKVPYNDPKLVHSQFAPVFFTINGMSIGFKREKLNNSTGLTNGDEILSNISLSTDIANSSQFDITLNTGGSYEKEREDELRGSWSVNNEILTVKDEAYTYNEYYRDLDDKSRRISEQAAFRNTLLGSVNQALGVSGGLVAASAKLNPYVLGARVGQAGIGIVQSIMDYQDMKKQNEIAYQQKYTGLLLQSSIMSGASLSYLKRFNGDLIKTQIFDLNKTDKDYWDEYFHKYGYETLEYKKITLRTRKYFNYIKAELNEEILTPILNEKSKEDLRRRFREGITFFHSTQTQSPNWDQDKENWEL